LDLVKMARPTGTPQVINIIRNFEAKLVNSVRGMIRELEVELLSNPSNPVNTPPDTSISSGDVSFDQTGSFLIGSEDPTPEGLRYTGSTPLLRQWSTPDSMEHSKFTFSFPIPSTGGYMGQSITEDETSIPFIQDGHVATPAVLLDISEDSKCDQSCYSEETTRNLSSSLKRKLCEDASDSDASEDPHESK
jgi:hypothetical protein